MVHREVKKWVIHVLFSHAWTCWLIRRDLTSTKAGNDSVVSHLYRVQATVDEIGEKLDMTCGREVITSWVLLSSCLPSEWCEELPALGQKEVDTMILDLLPSREVTMSSCVLMQDSDNVFEMTPALRIHVFKQLFGLLDMDHIREHLADLKKTTQLRRQVLQEDTTVQDQFGRQYTQLRETVQAIYAQWTQTELLERCAWRDQPFLVDMQQFDFATMQVNGALFAGYDPDRTHMLLAYLEEQIQTELLRQGQITQLVEEQARGERTLHLQEEELLGLRRRAEELQHLLGNVAEDEVRVLYDQIWHLDAQIEWLTEQLPHAAARAYGLVFTSLTQAQELFTAQIAEAKQLQQQVQLLEEKELARLAQQTKREAQAQGLEEQIARLQTDQIQAEKFRCEKIQDDCPYVSVIRKVTTTTIEDQLSYLTNQLAEYRTSMLPELMRTGETLHTEKNHLLEQIAVKKEMFTSLSRKEVQELFTRAQILTEEKKQIMEQVRELQARREQFARLLEEQERIRAREHYLVHDNERLAAERDRLIAQLAAYDRTIDHAQIATTKQLLALFQRFTQLIDSLGVLVMQVVDRGQQIRVLQEKEGLVKDLLQIFQKELLLVVLQDFLPVLEEVINSYLQQIVSFTLRFELPKTMQEQIELAIWIEDDHGKRAVKSLSGGQKAVLRLCWILAVSTLFKQEYLLLDETINSLDHEAIGRVAELLDAFVKQRDVTFYLVTHAPQIQEMGFWRRVIELDHVQ